MRKDRLYLYTFISLALIFLLIASLGVGYMIKININLLIENQIENSKREANEIARLSFIQFEKETLKKDILDQIQHSITDTHKNNSSFISVFDWSGKSVCHPDVTKVNQEISSDQSLLNSVKEGTNLNQLYDLLMDYKKKRKGAANLGASEVIYISAIKNSDLIVASHINLDKILVKIIKLKRRLYTIFILMGILFILGSFFIVRFLGSYYEKQLEEKNTNLESELINLSKLNRDLVSYQQKVEQEEEEKQPMTKEVENTNSQNLSKLRLLTYVRNELIPTPIDEIAYIFTENTITYVVRFNGKRSTTNSSLDEIFEDLEPSLFFRANRQFIISIKSIEKIIKYGNSQLKILVQDSDVEIIISKNKAAEFRKWLSM